MSIPVFRRASDRTPALQRALVADVMHRGVVSCPPDSDLKVVARTMATNHIHSLVVSGIERDEHGEHLYWGLLTSLDLVAAAGTGASAAREVCRSQVVTVQAHEPLVRAAELMAEHRLTHLIVVSAEAKPIGVVSTLDIAGCVAWGEA